MEKKKDKKPKEKKPLPDYIITPQQEEFCNYYIKLRHGTKAAILAKYSPHTAAEQASRLLKSVNIRYRIRDLMDEQFKRLKISSDHVLRELFKLSSADIRDAYNEDGELKDIQEMPEHLAKAIAAIETDELFDGFGKDRERIGYTKKIKLFDKPRSLELLGKHFKLFVDVTEHRGLENLADQIKQARQRGKDCKTLKK